MLANAIYYLRIAIKKHVNGICYKVFLNRTVKSSCYKKILLSNVLKKQLAVED